MLDDEQVAKVRFTIHTRGWQDVIAQRLVQRGREVHMQLGQLPSERVGPLRGMDDQAATFYLRGRLEEIRWMLSTWENEVKAANHNIRLDELDGVTRGAAPANLDAGAREPR